MREYEFKHYSTTITIPYDGKRDSLMALIKHKTKEAEIGLRHNLDNILPSLLSYRIYRRGKNRCLFCGMKLGTEEHGEYET